MKKLLSVFLALALSVTASVASACDLPEAPPPVTDIELSETEHITINLGTGEEVTPQDENLGDLGGQSDRP